MLRVWRKWRDTKKQAANLAQDALAAARAPFYYRDLGVPDSFDGRFEVAVLELFLRLYPLKDANPALSQPAFTAFFRQMELTLREMGVGDLGVPRHMKRMMTGFNGRVRSYWAAIEGHDHPALTAALTRNVYGTAPDTAPETVEKLANSIYERLAIAKEASHEIAAR